MITKDDIKALRRDCGQGQRLYHALGELVAKELRNAGCDTVTINDSRHTNSVYVSAVATKEIRISDHTAYSCNRPTDVLLGSSMQKTADRLNRAVLAGMHRCGSYLEVSKIETILRLSRMTAATLEGVRRD